MSVGSLMFDKRMTVQLMIQLSAEQDVNSNVFNNIFSQILLSWRICAFEIDQVSWVGLGIWELWIDWEFDSAVPEIDNMLYGDGGKVFDWKPIVLPTAPSATTAPIVTSSATAAAPTAPTAPSSPFNHITPSELSSVHLRHVAPPEVSQHPIEAPALPVKPMMPTAPAAPAPPVLHTNQETAKPATPTAPTSPFTPFATTPTHIHLTPEPFGHLTAANMTWRFVRTENQTLANLTLI